MRRRLLAAMLSMLLLTAPAALAESPDLRNLTDAQLIRLAQDIVLEQQRRSTEGLGYMASGFLERYFIGLKSAEVKEVDGARTLVLTYDFSHEVEEPRVFLWAITTRAFQDGVALETAFLFDHAGTANSLKEIQKGTTLEVAEAFQLTSDSPVELEIAETFSFSDEVLKITVPVT